MGWLKRAEPAVLLLLTLAFIVRVYRLGFQSLWYDEGLSLRYALSPLPELLSLAAQSEHPPLYFLLLHFWLPLAGASELALRFPSALAGVLGVALTYKVAQKLAGRPVAMAAALFMALSPFHAWHSQEARMYSLALSLALLSLYLFLRLLAEGFASRGIWLSYALASAAGLYTHLAFGLVLLSQAAFLPLWLGLGRPGKRPQRRRAVLLALGGRVLAALLFLPWLPATLSTYAANDSYWPGRLNPWAAARSSLIAFVIGERVEIAGGGALALPVAISMALGLVMSWRRERARRGPWGPAWALILWYLAVPALVLAWVLYDKPKFAPRYLLPLLPAFYFLLAQAALPPKGRWAWGGQTLMSALRLGLSLGLLFVSVWALGQQYFNPRYAKEDYRGLARFLGQQATSQDAIILLGGHMQAPFTPYYRGAAPLFPLPPPLIPSLQQPIRRSDLSALNEIAVGRRLVWVMLWQAELADPGNMVMEQLDLAGNRVDPGRAFHGLHLAAFAIPGRPAFPIAFQPSHPRRYVFEDQLALLGYDLDRRQAQPGEALRLTLYWKALAQMAQDFTTFTHLLNAGEHIYGQHDKPPINPFYTTRRWAVGDLLKDEYALTVLPGTPPGRYVIEVGLYQRPSLRRLAIHNAQGEPAGDRILLAEVEVERGKAPPPQAYRLPHPASVPLAQGLRLLGYDLEPSEPRPGQAFRVIFFWQAEGRLDADYHVRVAVRDKKGALVAAGGGPTADGTYPTSQWQPDEVVRDIHSLALPAGLPPGSYRLEVALAPGGDPVVLGDLPVR